MVKSRNKTKSSKAPVSLSEEDYLGILGVYARLNRCNTKNDLLNVLKDALLPLFQAQAGLYVWTNPGFSKSTGLIGHVGIPDNEVNTFLEIAPYNSFNTIMMNQSRSVFAHDVDYPREEANSAMDLFFKAHPQYKRSDYPYFDRFKSAFVTADMPEPTLAVALHRIDDCVIPWTFRDVRVMELLRPHLLQTIKTICLNAELTKYQALCETLADSPTPTALVAMDMRVVFLNPAFKNVFHVERGQRLPGSLSDLLQKEVGKFEPPYKVEDGKIELPFHSTDQGAFRLSFALLGNPDDKAKKHWLLHMKPVVEPYARMNLLAQKKGVTGRELEICVLMRDGKGTGEIANRLFISPNTVKTHLKSIYSKFGVSSRAKLIATLHRGTVIPPCVEEWSK